MVPAPPPDHFRRHLRVAHSELGASQPVIMLSFSFSEHLWSAGCVQAPCWAPGSQVGRDPALQTYQSGPCHPLAFGLGGEEALRGRWMGKVPSGQDTGTQCKGVRDFLLPPGRAKQ